MNEILTRTSIRAFKEQPVEQEKLELILKAAMQAPSAGNQQPWEFIVVTKRELLDKLAMVSPYASALKTAQAAIVLLNNEKYHRFNGQYVEQDLGACAQNILLMCEHVGLGAVWLGITPDIERMQFVSTLFELPKEVSALAILPLGYKQNSREAKSRYDESRVGYNCYNQH